MNRFLTIRQASDALNVHPNTVYRYVEEGTLPAFRQSKDWFIEKRDVTRLKNSRRLAGWR